MHVPPDQVQQREQEDPHDIHEVPVETADLNRIRVLTRDGTVPRPNHHPGQDAEPDDHVQSMEAGHDEIQREENLRVAEILLLELKAWPWNVMLDELLVVFDALDTQKGRAQQHRQTEKHQELRAVT